MTGHHDRAQFAINITGKMVWWFKRMREHDGRASSEDQEMLRCELPRCGASLDIPDMVRSQSSQSSLGSCSDLALDGASQKEQKAEKGASFLEVLGGIHHAVEAQHKVAAEKLDSDESGSDTNTVDVLPTVSAATRPTPQTRLTEPYHQQQEHAPLIARRRSICPGTALKSACDSPPSKKEPPDLPWRSEAMQTFPKTSFRKSRFCSSEDSLSVASSTSGISSEGSVRSISFSPNVHVLEYQRDLVQYSSPDAAWSRYFS
jgi:flagellar hook-basal body complex protein FliE